METINDLLSHQKAFNERLYLVASENSPSITARLAFLTDVINRYYFPLEGNKSWAFPGNEWLEAIHNRCERLLKELTGAKYVNIRPISGINAMTIALASLTRGWDTIATFSPENGGHSTTSVIARRLGAKTAWLPYNQKEFTLDIEAIPEFIAREKISLVYLDQAHILFPHRLKELRFVVPKEIPIYYDGSHVMGLIFGRNFQDPLQEGATLLGGSTHKTIPGPHKAFIATNDDVLYEKIWPYARRFVSHEHGGDIAALTIILEEMRGKWEEYAMRVVQNAQYFAKLLQAKGFFVAATEHGFTKSHQIWVDIDQYKEAFEAVKLLASHNIIVNSINAPSILGRLSLRIGVQEITYLGANETTMEAIADIFEEIFLKKNESIENIRHRVAEIKRSIMPALNEEYLEKIFALLKV